MTSHEQASPEVVESTTSSDSNPTTAFVQLVDGEGKFGEHLDGFVRQTNMRGKGDNYNILSVFGPQSSGKSTLLNRLFGAGFPTMDASTGRYQVTLGVCMAKANKTLDKDILLMDLEGTDSKERGSGDDNMAFERKISLFALAISEVLLVNMWMQDIGRYNAANLALLRIVFELNLQLFTKDKSSKTLLLFVIRDHIREMTPLDALRDQMIKDIEKLWGTIMKPKQFEDSKVTDFFDFEFTSLPHKILKEELFDQEIEIMRERFVNPNAKDYVFNPKYKKSVPIDDFEMYAKDIWEVIYANKDLDIPTQKEMLAMYRCDEISSALYRTFEEQIVEWSEILKKKQLVSKFGVKCREVIDKTLETFMDQTKLYVPDVVHKKCEEFKERMVSEVAILFTSQIALVKQQSLDSFKKFMFSNVQKKIDDNEIVDDFTNTTKQTHDHITNFFTGLAEESIYPGLANDEQFNFKPSLESLEEEIKTIIEEYRHKQVEVIVKIQIDEMKKHIREDINQWVTKPTEKLWLTLSNYLVKVVTEEKEHLAKSLKELDISDCSKFVPRIRIAARNEIVTKVREMSNVISLTLTSRFEDLFKRDENNILRTWKNMEQIKEDYTKARQEAIKILDIFFLCRLDHRELDDIHLRLPKLDESGGIGDFAFPTSDDIQKALKSVKIEEASSGDEGNEVVKKDVMSLFEENLIMSENICIRAYENYIMRTDNIYGDVQRAQLIAQQNKANIPYWVYILLVVLGWDEIYSVIRSPFYLILILLIAVVIFQTWLKSKVKELIEDPETNPTIAFALQMAQIHIFPYLAMANVERIIPPPVTTSNTATSNSSSSVRLEENTSETNNTVRQRSQVKKAKMENQISLHQHDE